MARRPDYLALAVFVTVSAAVIWVCFFARGELGETLRILFFLGLAVWTIVSGMIELVRWFRMSPEQRKEASVYAWLRRNRKSKIKQT